MLQLYLRKLAKEFLKYLGQYLSILLVKLQNSLSRLVATLFAGRGYSSISKLMGKQAERPCNEQLSEGQSQGSLILSIPLVARLQGSRS